MTGGRAETRAEAELSVVLELGEDGSETMPVVLRPLRSQDDYRQCEELERDIWGQDFSECVPTSLLMVSQKVGGVAAGAFDSDGRMVGMVYGLTGPRQGRLVHWSHMLAVRQELRGRGLGKELKLYQRRVVRERDAEVMLWTYDPLVSRNAYLNICRLGARPAEYVRDLYGDDTASELHTGLGTDRFVVEWHLADGGRAPESPTAFAEAPEIVHLEEGRPSEPPYDIPSVRRVRIAVPRDIQAVKAADAELGLEWRRSTRSAIEACFDEGFEVVGFDAAGDDGPCAYLLRRSVGS